MKYISNPTIIDAIQYKNSEQSHSDIIEFLTKHDPTCKNWRYVDLTQSFYVYNTSGIEIIVLEGYYIIPEMNGYSGFYTCNPNVFKTKYRSIAEMRKEEVLELVKSDTEISVPNPLDARYIKKCKLHLAINNPNDFIVTFTCPVRKRSYVLIEPPVLKGWSIMIKYMENGVSVNNTCVLDNLEILKK